MSINILKDDVVANGQVDYPTTDQPVQADEYPFKLDFTNNISQWANVDPVNVVLSKIHGYFGLPTFVTATTPTLYNNNPEPYIVTQFNYFASGNFVITGYPTFPIAPNYVLCVRYNKGNKVYRYKIWSYADDNIFYPLYNGQRIAKNFCLEVWNYINDSNTTIVSQVDTSIMFQTSRTQIRMSATCKTSYVESLAFPVVTLFNTNTTLPLIPDLTSSAFFYNPASLPINTPVVAWLDSLNVGPPLLQGVTQAQPTVGTTNKAVTFAANQILGSGNPIITNGSLTNLYMLFSSVSLGTAANSFISIYSGNVVYFSLYMFKIGPSWFLRASLYNFNNQTTNTATFVLEDLQDNIFYILEMDFVTGELNILNVTDGSIQDGANMSNPNSIPAATLPYVNLGSATDNVGTIQVGSLIGYTNSNYNRNQTVNYLIGLAGQMYLPLTFNPDAVGTFN